MRTTRTMHHAFRDSLMKRWMRLCVWDFSTHNGVNLLWGARSLIGARDQKYVRMRQPTLLKLHRVHITFHNPKDVALCEVSQ